MKKRRMSERRFETKLANLLERRLEQSGGSVTTFRDAGVSDHEPRAGRLAAQRTGVSTDHRRKLAPLTPKEPHYAQAARPRPCQSAHR